MEMGPVRSIDRADRPLQARSLRPGDGRIHRAGAPDALMIGTALAGFSLALSLILPIGAQNSFVLRQELRREHVFFVCLLCALSDAVLMMAGVFGLAAV